MAVNVLYLCLRCCGNGTTEGRGRSDGASASRRFGASCESCGSGEGHWVGRTNLWRVLGGYGDFRSEGVPYYHAMNSGSGCSERTAVAVYGRVYGTATCGRAAFGLGGDIRGAVARVGGIGQNGEEPGSWGKYEAHIEMFGCVVVGVDRL